MTGSTVLRRVVACVTALLAVGVAFLAGFLVSDAHHEGPAGYRLTAAGLDTGLSCDRLREWNVDHGLRQVTAWGWRSPIDAEAVPLTEGADAGTASVPRAAAPGLSVETRTGSATGTNVQEADVDEPDVVKVSGDLLVRIDDGALKTDDLSGTEPRRLGVAPLDRIGDPQLLLAGDRAVVIGREVEVPTAGAPPVVPPPRTWVRTYDLRDPADPTLVDSRLYDGSVVAARQVGSVVRLVLDGGPPSLDFTQPSSQLSPEEALDHNRQVVRDSTVADWLPTVATDADGQGSSHPLLDCADVSVPEIFNGLGTLSVVGFDPADPDVTDVTAVATASDTAYLSTAHLYVATSAWSQLTQGWGPLRVGGNEPTRLYGFDLSGTSARYVGMGTVEGTVAGSWSMDEHDGALRVAVSSSGGPAGQSMTSVVTLRPQSGRLLDVGHLEGLGLGQRLTSVRWFDDIAVLVTFRQTDPFYVVDVADPTDLRVLGALHLPGWSSYLHPVGPHLVLGLGQTSPQPVMVEPAPPPKTLPPMPVPSPPVPRDGGAAVSRGDPGAVATASPEPDPTWRVPVVRQHAKATLFDISDLAHPRDVDTIAYPVGTVPMAATEPHQVTWLPDRQTLLAVLSGGSWSGLSPPATQPAPRAWVAALTVRDGSLRSRLVPVDATDPHDIRTVPLADGRVVLVAGDRVRFLTV
jgi:hypothetical protein